MKGGKGEVGVGGMGSRGEGRRIRTEGGGGGVGPGRRNIATGLVVGLLLYCICRD